MKRINHLVSPLERNILHLPSFYTYLHAHCDFTIISIWTDCYDSVSETCAQTCNMYNVYMYILCLLEEWRVWLMFSWQGSACSMCELLYVLLTDVFMHKYACRMAHGSWFGWLCNFTHVILNVHAIFTQSIYLMHFVFFWQAIVSQQNIHLCARNALPTVIEFAQPWKHLNIFIQIPQNKQCSFLPCRFLIWRHTQILMMVSLTLRRPDSKYPQRDRLCFNNHDRWHMILYPL